MQQIKPDDDDSFLDNFVIDYLRKTNCQHTLASYWLEKSCSTLPPPVDSHQTSFLHTWWENHWELCKEALLKKRNYPLQPQIQMQQPQPIIQRLPSSVQLGLTPILPGQQLLQSAETAFKGYDFNAGLQIPLQNDIFVQNSQPNQLNLRENNTGNPFFLCSNPVFHEPTCEPECQEHIEPVEEEVPGMFCKPIMKNGKRCFEQCGVACCLDTTPDTAVDSGKSSGSRRKPPKVVISRASNFRGVSRNGRSWQAIIMVNKAKKYVGSYKSEHEAAVAYDKAAILYHGDKAMTNFSYNAAEIEAVRLEKEAQDLKTMSGNQLNTPKNTLKIEDG